MKISSRTRFQQTIFCLATIGLLLSTQSLVAQPNLQTYLDQAQLDRGEEAFLNYLSENPGDDKARFELGTLQFFQAIEGVGQALYRHAVPDRFLVASMPLLRLPVPENPRPEPVNYEQFREVFERACSKFEEAAKTLERVDDETVMMKLKLFKLHLDWNSNGVADVDESITDLTAFYMGQRPTREQVNNVEVHFDYSDVYWLRAYCNVMTGIVDTALAYDHAEFWNVIAHRLFDEGQVEFEFLMEEREILNEDRYFDMNEILDWIAGIHNMRFKLINADRLKKAHAHFTEALQLSRKMWQAIQDETDNSNEFLPNPRQDSVVTRTKIEEPMVKAWFEFLDEADSIMQGKTLLPFWRGKEGKRGLNIYRVFHEPRDFDLVLWVHGSAAVPYLEQDGKITSEATWRRFDEIFGGDFFWILNLDQLVCNQARFCEQIGFPSGPRKNFCILGTSVSDFEYCRV